MSSNHRITIARSRLEPLISVACAAGAPVDQVIASLGLDGAGERAALADYFRLQQRLAAVLGDETCQLSARQLLPGSTDFIMAHLGKRGTLADAMQIVARSYNLLHGGAYNSVHRRAGAVVYEIDDTDFPFTMRHDRDAVWFAMETTLVFLHAVLTLISEGAARKGLLALDLKRPAGAGNRDHLAFWMAPIRFGARRYGVRYEASLALETIDFPEAGFLTSEAIYGRIIDLIDRPDPGRSGTRAAVASLIAAGVVEQREVAERVGVSVATLRRRLTGEDSSFRALRREALNQRAVSMLRDGAKLSDIAETLGFADFRSFSRAFREWNGMTPRAWRDTQRRPRLNP